MKLHRTVKYSPELFNLIPLVTVLFLVVMLVTLSNTFVLQPGIAVNLPVSSFALGPQANALLVTVKAEPAPVIYFRDRKFSVAEFEQALGPAEVRERSLIVKADRMVSFDLVSQVLNIGLRQGYSVAIAATHLP
jgi:biopolymer transport protein ExbD